MLVSQILKSKPDATIITISPDALVSEAVALLTAHRIGAVIVSPDGVQAAGILSERDIVRALGRSGPDCLAGPVKGLMTAQLVVCARGDLTDAVLQKMTDGRFRHMPVMEDGRMVGLISIGDVVKMRLEELGAEKDALEGMIKGF